MNDLELMRINRDADQAIREGGIALSEVGGNPMALAMNPGAAIGGIKRVVEGLQMKNAVVDELLRRVVGEPGRPAGTVERAGLLIEGGE